MRSRNDKRDEPCLDGESSGIGDLEPSRPRGLRRVGILEFAEFGVSDETLRVTPGDPLWYGLGVVMLRGLKLCPTSESFVLTELFQRGRLSARLELDRGGIR
jgi:hypothetical protein